MEAISYRKCQYLFGTRAPEDVKPGAEVQAHSHAFDWSDIGSHLHPTNKISKKSLKSNA